MKNLIYATNLSIDGCFDHYKLVAPDDEVAEYFSRFVEDWLTIYRLKTSPKFF